MNDKKGFGRLHKRKYDRIIVVTVTDEEYAMLKESAEKAKLSVQDFVRAAALCAVVEGESI